MKHLALLTVAILLISTSTQLLANVNKPTCHTVQKEMQSTITCYYQSKNLAKVYQHYRANTEKSEQHYLLAKLPTSYQKVTIDTDFAEIIYRPTKTGMSIDQ